MHHLFKPISWPAISSTESAAFGSVEFLAVACSTFDRWWTLGPKVRVRVLGKVKLSHLWLQQTNPQTWWYANYKIYPNEKDYHLEVVIVTLFWRHCWANLFPYLPLSILQSRSHYKFMKTETLGIEERGREGPDNIALHQNVSSPAPKHLFCPNSRCVSPQSLYIALTKFKSPVFTYK